MEATASVRCLPKLVFFLFHRQLPSPPTSIPQHDGHLDSHHLARRYERICPEYEATTAIHDSIKPTDTCHGESTRAMITRIYRGRVTQTGALFLYLVLPSVIIPVTADVQRDSSML